MQSTIQGSISGTSLSWTPPTSLATGNDYQIKVVDFNNSGYNAISNNFTITDASSCTLGVTSPSPGAVWTKGTSYAIQWTKNGSACASVATVTLWKSGSFQSLIQSSASGTSLSWTPPTSLATGNDFQIKVVDYNNSGYYAISDNFTITDASSCTLGVTSPSTGAIWTKGTSYAIQWTKSGSACASTVIIELWKSGSRQFMIEDWVSGTSFSWVPPTSLATGSDYQIVVGDDNNSAYDTISEFFTITDSSWCTLEVTSPLAGATWTKGASYTIQWTKSGSACASTVIVQLWKSGSMQSTIQGSILGTSLSWTPPTSLATGNDYQIKVVDFNNSGYNAISNNFTITDASSCTLGVTSPSPGVVWTKGTSYAIHWTKSGSACASVATVTLWKSGSFQSLIQSSASGTSLSWTPPTSLATGNDYQIKVVDYNNSGYYAVSDNFTITDASSCALGVTSPSTGAIWTKGTSHTIQWTKSGSACASTVDLELLQDGTIHRWIQYSVPGTSFSWIPPTSLPTGNYQIIVWDSGSTNYLGYSGSFSLIDAAPCTLTCTATVPSTGTSGSAISFKATATPTNCTGTPTFTWNFGDNIGATLQNPSHAYTSAGSYSWTMIVTQNGKSCSDSGTITVNAPPICTVTCSASAAPTTGPAPLAVNFTSTATALNCSGSLMYYWNFRDGSTSAHQNPTHTYSSAGTYTWTFSAVADGKACLQTGTIVVTPPPITGSLTIGNGSGMPGSSVTLPISLVGNGNTVCGTSNKVSYDSTKLTYVETTLGPAGQTAGKQVFVNQNPTTKVITIGVSGFNTTPIQDGIVAYLKFTVISGATGSPSVTSTCGLSDCAGIDISAVCNQGTVTIGPSKLGDCDGNGSVSIGEVQKAINMFLGTQAVGCGVDCNSSGTVSIGEVQKVINGFLGVSTSC
jgi:PKD repeat protein